jgi:hypothetical protein
MIKANNQHKESGLKEALDISPNPGEMALQILESTERLTQILEKENSLLREMKLGEINAMQRDKLKLAVRLEEMKRKLREKPDAFGTLSDEQKENARALFKRFEEASENNQRRLMVSLEVNNQIVEAIKSAVIEHEGKLTYTDQGNSGDKKRILSVNLNETV